VFFLQAEDGIRDFHVTGVQTCALPILRVPAQVFIENEASNICSVIEISGHDRTGLLYQVTQAMAGLGLSIINAHIFTYGTQVARSEERRVGKERGWGWWREARTKSKGR